MKNRAEFITARINREIEAAKATVQKFTAELQNDPAHALAWGDKAFKAAGVIKVFEMAVAQVVSVIETSGCEAEAAYDNVAALCSKDIIRSAANIPSSSSQCSNLIDQHVLAAKVAFVEIVDC